MLTLGFDVQTEPILVITFIVSYMTSSFVSNGLQFSENIYEAYSQKIIITSIILILICYIIYKLDINILDTIFYSNDELVKDKLTNTNKNYNFNLNNTIVIFDKSVEKILDSFIILLIDVIVPAGNQIRIVIAMGSIAAAVATVLKGVPMNLATKVASVFASGIVGCAGHVVLTNFNRIIIRDQKLYNDSNSSSI